MVPVQPSSPAIGHGAGRIDFHDPCSFPVSPPPRRRMKTPEILGPPPGKMFGNGTLDFPDQSRACNPYLSPRLDKSSEIVQVEVVRPVVAERIDRHDGVEELRRERQRPRIGLDRVHTILHAGIPNPLVVLRALNHRSVAQTCTPNSRRRKIDDAARPQPRSSTRIPGRTLSAEVSHSVSQSEFAPPLTLAIIHSGWYCEDRGKEAERNRLSGVTVPQV